MKILLTNDDSHSSPLLRFVIEKLEQLGDLTVVVPKEEQSWKGKAMSRFSPLHLEACEIQGRPAYTVDGTPADCVNIAVYHLFEAKPDLVVSGINAGLNAGAGFVFSSGTVGACFEGNIAGIPGVAFSQAFDTATRDRYLLDYTISPETIGRLAEQTRHILDRFFSCFLDDPRFLADPITWNVNLPFRSSPGIPFVPAALGHSWYGSCYQRHEFHFAHCLDDIAFDSRTQSDTVVLRNGGVSVTPMDIRTFAQLQETEVRALELLERFTQA